jgi:hypothetical protein
LAGEIATAFVRIRAKVDRAQFNRSVEQAATGTAKAGQKAGEQFGHGVVGGTRKGVRPITAIAGSMGATFAAIGIEKFFHSAVEGAIQAQEATDRVETGLKRLKIPAKDVEEAMQKNAAGARALGFSGREANDSLLLLTRLSGTLKGGMDGVSTAFDVARGKGISLEAATKAVTGAMFGNVRSLRQLGIRLAPATKNTEELQKKIQKLKDSTKGASDADKERITQQIRALQATKGQVKEADKVLTGQRAIALIQKKLGDQAEAFAKTSAGKLAIAAKQFDKIKVQIGAAVLPAIAASASFIVTQLLKVQGFLAKVKAAGSLKAKIAIVVTGLEEAKKAVSTALFGQTFAGGGKGRQDIHIDGIVDKIKQAFAAIDWSSVGDTITSGIAAGVQKGDQLAKSATDKVNEVIDAIQANQGKLADIGAVIIATIFEKLLDPSFWIAHWQLAIGVALAVFPAGKFAKIGELIGKVFGPMAAKIGVKAAEMMAKVLVKLLEPVAKLSPRLAKFLLDAFIAALKISGAIISAAFKLATAVVKAIFDRLNGITKGLLGAVLKIGVIAAIVGVVGSAVSAAGRLAKAIINGIKTGLSGLFSIVVDAFNGVKDAIANAASSALGWALGVGEAIVNGIVQGIVGIAGRIASALGGALTSAKKHALSLIGAGSPSKVFADEVGGPISTGIALGITNKSPEVKKALVVMLSGAARAAVVEAKQNLMSLSGSLADSVGQIIDAATAKKIKPLQSKLDAMQAKQSAADLAGQRADINAQLQGGKNEGESDADFIKRQADLRKQLADMDEAARQAALEDQIAKIQTESDARKDKLTRDIADLTAKFNAGLISSADYAKQLNAMLKANGASVQSAGALLGFAFAQGFKDQMADVTGQIKALGAVLGLGGGTAGGAGVDSGQVVSPLTAVHDQLSDAHKDLSKESGKLTKTLRVERDARAVLAKKGLSPEARQRAQERLADARKAERAERAAIARDKALIRALNAIFDAAQKGGNVTITGGNAAASDTVNSTAGAAAR